MSDPSRNSTVEEVTKGIKTLVVDNQEVENLKEIVLQGVKSIETVTELISQLVYEEDKRRSQFKDILKMIKNLLELNSHKTHTIARQLGRKHPSLTGSLARMLMDLADLEDLVSCKEIGEMKAVIDDLDNW
jgi:lipopolysaccharide biosynthesis regulator YciM